MNELIGTFIAVFTATTMGQVSSWWFKKELEHRLDKNYENIKSKFKRFGGIKMGKLVIDIEKSGNGGFIITHYVTSPTVLQRIGGAKPEKESLPFETFEKMTEWIKGRL